MSNPTTERDELANRIKMLRRGLGLSIQRLAATAKMSAGYLSEIERGRSAISGEKLTGLAQSLGVTVDYLLSGRAAGSSSSTITIPPGLSAAAESLNLSYAETIRLLAGRESLVARRSSNAAVEWAKEEWIGFYQKVKPYL
jgi:transcriptional regulator with XRE-family HTH domain